MLLAAIVATFSFSKCQAATPAQVIELWPGVAPGDEGKMDEEKDLTKPSDGLVAGKPVIRLGNVAKPTIAIYPPPAGLDTGAAVVVCPGGGYHILAMDLEGTEIWSSLLPGKSRPGIPNRSLTGRSHRRRLPRTRQLTFVL